MWCCGWIEVPVNMEGRSKVSDAFLVQVGDKFLQFVASPFEVCTIVGVDIGRTSSTVGEPSHCRYERICVARLYHLQVDASNGEAGK